MNNYEPNSNRFKESQKEAVRERKKVEKVISGTATVKKKNGVQKFADVFIAEDVNNVKNYFLYEVLIPNIKKALTTVLKEGIDSLFGTRTVNSSASRTEKISYNRFSDPRYSDIQYGDSVSKRVYSYDKVVIPTRTEAEDIIRAMDEIMDQYDHVVSVADFYELAGVNDYDFTAHDYGWTDIRSADILRVSEGYIIKLPKAGPINKK
jgi:hypothetical protein